MNRILCLCLSLTVSVFAGELQLTLPPVVYAVPEVPMSIYHDNIALTEAPQNYRFDFQCDIGTNEERRWTVKPSDRDVGDHSLAITVKDASGRVLEQAKTTLHVSPRKSGEGKALRLLIVGDSLTHASIYPNEIASLFSRPGNPTLTLLGTHKPAAVKPGVAHEGYGGWKWADFLTKYTAPTPGATAGPLARKTTSPSSFLRRMAKLASSICRVTSKNTVAINRPTSSPFCLASTTASLPVPLPPTPESTKCSTTRIDSSPRFTRPRPGPFSLSA